MTVTILLHIFISLLLIVVFDVVTIIVIGSVLLSHLFYCRLQRSRLMADLKERLLPPKPASAVNLRESYRPSASGRQYFQGVDVVGLKKRGQGLRSWIRVDSFGNSQIIEVDKFTMMRRCDLPARDLRLLDPLFVYPSTILGREKAIVVNLEQIRCIITADEVLLLNSLDSYVLQYVVELQRRLTTAGVGEVWQSEGADLSRRRGSRSFDNVFGSTSPDYLPFEFRALEVALESACTFLDSQVRAENHQSFALFLSIFTHIFCIYVLTITPSKYTIG